MILEPAQRLQKSQLLGRLQMGNTHVTAHRETVLHASVQIDLVGLAGLAQNALGLVAVLGGPDVIDFCKVSFGFSQVLSQLGDGSYLRQQ
jgi:hypothetical protein